MQISTNLLFDRASSQLSTIQNELARSQATIAVQKQVLKPSDAPDQAAAITRLKSIISRNDNYASNLQAIYSRVNSESTALGSADDVLVRIKELAIMANNATSVSSTRQTIALEIQGLRDQLLSLANSTDTTGNYIFSGSKVKTPAFAAQSSGQVSYQGDQTRMNVAVGDQRSVPVNHPGSTAFVRVVRTDATGEANGVEFFQALDDLVAGVHDGSSSAMQRGLSEIDALHEGVVQAQAATGTAMVILEKQEEILDDTRLNLKSTLSQIEDLDMAAAITLMNKQLLSLEAAQNSFAKISQLSLFSYLR